MQLLVLGMHRSGTSSVTRLLNLAGTYFGPEGIATDPNDENPKGFWERRDVRAVCDGLLQSGGYNWWKIATFRSTTFLRKFAGYSSKSSARSSTSPTRTARFFVERLRVHGGDVRVVTGHFLLWPKTPVRQSTVYSL